MDIPPRNLPLKSCPSTGDYYFRCYSTARGNEPLVAVVALVPLQLPERHPPLVAELVVKLAEPVDFRYAGAGSSCARGRSHVCLEPVGRDEIPTNEIRNVVTFKTFQ